MPVKVLIVDDSSFFRNQIKAILEANPQIKVVGEASNGREAIDKTKRLNPDIITMDYEMPLMDGITSVRHIMNECPTPILMFSSLTLKGARVTLDALEAGAVDFLPKSYEKVSESNSSLRQVLIQKILTLAKPALKESITQAPRGISKVSTPSKPQATAKRYALKFDIVMIGTSTGGPVALQKVLTQLPANFSVPILLVQHMPGTFTGAFADRLNNLCKISVKEAKDGDLLKPGCAYLAPGGKQMMLSQKGKLKVMAGDERLNYKPSVDLTFGSAVKYYNRNALALVLTGMGADGREGARLLKSAGAAVWAQEGKTCVIDGMPSAIVKANLADEVIPLDDISQRLKDVIQ